MKKLLTLVAIPFFIACCKGQENNSTSESKNSNLEGNNRFKAEQNLDKSSGYKEKKLIRSGSMTFEVKDIEKVKQQIDCITEKYLAYFSLERKEEESKQAKLELKIRMPSTNYSSFVKEISLIKAKIISKNLTIREVTEEYHDNQIRLESKKRYLEQYYGLLKKANNIEEILLVEERIKPLQEEIEQIEGSLKYFDDRVAFSTLHIYLQEPAPLILSKEPTFFAQLVANLSSGWNEVEEFLLSCVEEWPLLIVFTVIISIFRKTIYQWKRKLFSTVKR